MQKLVWQNANGDSIDLTSGNYGITQWEGFSNTSLNIQSQQVPFQDGAVFLDALLNQRELSVTLKMQDNGNLEERYRMRRELIHILNPKLGEGYLIYTNDFISKRIKCVAQVPLFETHNSDTRGTPKASLSWTATIPYWEDLEESEIEFGIGEFPVLDYNGDIPTQLEIEFLTNGVINPKLVSMKDNKKIEYNGILNKNLYINTSLGKKSVYIQNLLFDIVQISNDIYSICYASQLGLFVGLLNNLIYTSYDTINWTVIKSGVLKTLRSVTYSPELELFIAVGNEGTVITSSDGFNWSLQNSGVSTDLYSVTNSTDLIIAVGDEGSIITSSDGINWTSRTSDVTFALRSVTHSSDLSLFVAVGGIATEEGGSVIITSSDGITWTSQSSGGVTRILDAVTYSSDLSLFIIVGGGGTVLTSSDGITWTSRTSGVSFNLSSVTYSSELNLFVSVGEGKAITSYNGTTWTNQGSISQSTRCIIYSSDLNLFVVVGSKGTIITSIDGFNWIDRSVINTEDINSIIFVDERKMYIAVGNRGTILTKIDGLWSKIESGVTSDLFSITYSKELNLFVAVGYRGTRLTSIDGFNWIDRSVSSLETLRSVTYSSDLSLFVAVGNSGLIKTSPDGITWTSQSSGISDNLYSVIYVSELNSFIAVGAERSILTSSDGINWTSRSLGRYETFWGITYSSELKLLIVVGSRSYTSKNGEDWNILPSDVSLRSITYSSELNLFVGVGGSGKILTSSNGFNWELQESDITNGLFSVVCSDQLKQFYIAGQFGTIIETSFANPINEINNITKDSDMGLEIYVGLNQFRLVKDSGDFRTRIRYRQKYLGV